MKVFAVALAALACSTLAASAGLPASDSSAGLNRPLAAKTTDVFATEARMGRRNPRRERRDNRCRNMPRACR